MGSATSQKSFLNKKVIILVVSLILTGVVMRYFSPANKLDARLFYTFDQAVSYLEGLSEVQKQNYFYAEMFDFWYMVNYTWLIFLAVKKWPAFVPGILDFLETSLIVTYLMSNELLMIHQALPLISATKWFSGFCLLGYLGYKRLRTAIR
jgi:hypothetical protein